MRKVAVQSVKGGVGKSTVSAGLCLGLRDMGFSVGYLELDISGTSGHCAFGIDRDSAPRLGLNTENSQHVPPVVDGIRMFALASHFSASACVGWKESDSEIELSSGDKVVDAGRRGFIQDILTRGVDWGDTEWLVHDLPPSTGQDVMSFYQYISDLFGVILISQPSDIAVVGLEKTIDLLKGEQKPIIGLVENMGSVLCPHCDHEFYPFACKGIDLRKLAADQDIPFLVSIPQVDSMERLQPYFARLAESVVKAKPRVFHQGVLGRRARLARGIEKSGARLIDRLLPRL